MSFCPAFSKLSNCLEDKKLKLIELISPKYWNRYAVHLIDPLIKYLRRSYLNSYSLDLVKVKSSKLSTCMILSLTTCYHKEPITIRIITTGEMSGEIGFYAMNNDNKLIHRESHNQPFLSFKSALETFLLNNSGNYKGYIFNYDHHKEVVKILQEAI